MSRILQINNLSRSSTISFRRDTIASPKLNILNNKVINRSLQMASFTRPWVKFAAVLGVSATATGTYYGLTSYRRYQTLKTGCAMNSQSMQIQTLPKIIPTTGRLGPTDLNFKVTLFQYCSCPFCCKTRAFLDYFGVNYDIVEVDPVFRKKLEWSKYKKVPTLLAYSSSENPQIYQISDSTVIISSMGSFLLSKRSLENKKEVSLKNKTIEDLGQILRNFEAVEYEDETGKKVSQVANKYFLMLGDINSWELEKRETNLAEERQWREWTDSVLVHSLSPNIYRTIPEALQAFNNFSSMGNWEQHFTWTERSAAVYLGSAVMWLVGKKLKRKHRLKDDVRESLYDNCRQWTKAIGPNRSFMGGEHPNLADLSVYGVLSSIEGCTAFQDLLRNTNIGPWYIAMKNACKSQAGAKQLQSM